VIQPPFVPRLLAPTVERALGYQPVVAVVGARQSGKTTLVQRLGSDRAYLSFDDEANERAASADPVGFVAGLPPRITLDEIQRAPRLLSAIKRAVDRDRTPGRFLLTGSANLLLLPRVTESLAGRMAVCDLQPLTEAEKERRPGRFLSLLLREEIKPRIAAEAAEPAPTLEERLVAGGYPAVLPFPPATARDWHRQYLRTVMERDVRDVARIRDANELVRLLALLANRAGRLFRATNLARDLGLHRTTVEHYVSVLERLFLVRRLPAWRRSPARRLIRSPKVHLVDSGVAATLAALTAPDMAGNRAVLGHLLESFVVQQLTAQAAWNDPDLRLWHYRDKDQVEVDVVVTRGARTWGFEVKAAASASPADGRGLARLAERCGKDFAGGVVFYTGRDVLPLPDPRMVAAPVSELWTR
jgi:hypothetical protein